MHDKNFEIAAEIQREGRKWTIINIGRSCIAVLETESFLAAVRRGKAFKRSAALKARIQGEDDTHV